jgi:hypothetical protein
MISTRLVLEKYRKVITLNWKILNKNTTKKSINPNVKLTTQNSCAKSFL